MTEHLTGTLDLTLVAEGLGFPEGPIAMPDGSILLVEMERCTLSRVHPDGVTEVVAAGKKRKAAVTAED